MKIPSFIDVNKAREYLRSYRLPNGELLHEVTMNTGKKIKIDDMTDWEIATSAAFGFCDEVIKESIRAYAVKPDEVIPELLKNKLNKLDGCK